MMNGHEKSDPVIVAVKPANKAERSAAELVERRAGTEGNSSQPSTCRTPSRVSVPQALVRIRQRVAVNTRGGSRMRESRTYGSVRGARGNSRPYRELPVCCNCSRPLASVNFDGVRFRAAFRGHGRHQTCSMRDRMVHRTSPNAASRAARCGA